MSSIRTLATLLSMALAVPLVAQRSTSLTNGSAHQPPSAVRPDTAVTYVKVTSADGKRHGQLAQLLKAEAAKAKADGRTPFVVLGATWCGPCLALEQMLTDQRMIDAFFGAYVVHLDVDEWTDELTPLGYNVTGGTIPAIFGVDQNGRATSAVLRDTVGVVRGIEVAAPRIKRFVQAHLWNSVAPKTSLP